MHKPSKKHSKIHTENKRTNQNSGQSNTREIIGTAITVLASAFFVYMTFYTHNTSVWIAFSGVIIILTGLTIALYDHISSFILFPMVLLLIIIALKVSISLQKLEPLAQSQSKETSSQTMPAKKKSASTSNKKDTVYVEKKVIEYVPTEKKEDLTYRPHFDLLGISEPKDFAGEMAKILSAPKDTFRPLSNIYSPTTHSWVTPNTYPNLFDPKKINYNLSPDIDTSFKPSNFLSFKYLTDTNKPRIKIEVGDTNIAYKDIFESTISINITHPEYEYVHFNDDLHIQIIGNSIISINDIDPVFPGITSTRYITNVNISEEGAILDIPRYCLPRKIKILHTKPENFQFVY